MTSPATNAPAVRPPLTRAAQRTLDTASALFYAHGIHAVGVDRIALEAGVTKKTLYERFGSKENLVLAYLRQREDSWREVLAEHLDRHPEPGIDRVLAVYDATADWYADRPSKGCSAVNARAETDLDPAGQPIAEEVTAHKTWMLRRIVSLVDEAGFADPERLGRLLMLLYEGALVTLGTRSFDTPLAAAREAARTLLGESST